MGTRSAELVPELIRASLDDPGFDFSVLSEFRARLLTDDAETVLFDTVLNLFRDASLLKVQGKQHTDSPHMVAAIRQLHRLENVGETMRHTLNRLAVVAPDWLGAQADLAWVERYRLPKENAAQQALATLSGQEWLSSA